MTKKQQLINEYKKHIRRIKSFIRNATKRGFDIDYEIPRKPKRITEGTIRRLSKIRPDYLYKKSSYASEETFGEIVPGVKGRKIERSRAAKKAADTLRKRRQKTQVRKSTTDTPYIQEQTRDSNTDTQHNNEQAGKSTSGTEYTQDFFVDIILSNYRAHIAQFNQKAYLVLSKWLDKLIADKGKKDVSIMLEKGANNGLIVTYKIVYSETALYNYISSMLDYLPDTGNIYKDEFMDAMEEDEWLEDV